MNTKLFFALIAGFALSMFSCNSGYNGMPDTSATDKSSTTDPVHDESSPSGFNPNPAFDDYDPTFEDLISTVDDIISYNTTTGETVFKDSIFKELTTYHRDNNGILYNRIILYYDDKPLLDDIKICRMVDSNPWYGFIVLDITGEGFDELRGVHYGYSFRLRNSIDSWRGEITTEREEYAKKLKAEWDIFIKYLRDAGKVVK
ncbi:MAG: hypothetical protein LBC19_13825 [Tannerella sp.]|jgi:hypothetical protein|nr:hypothetical protein [Tannerella sp.]